MCLGGKVKMTERIYFKRNVGYTIGVRLFPGDWNGVALTVENPVVGIDADKLKDFKRANKSLLERGMLIQIPEPSTDFENANLLTDEEITEVIKNPLKLKKLLKEMDSEPAITRILEEAKFQGRPPKTVALIQARLEEISDITLAEMQGVV